MKLKATKDILVASKRYRAGSVFEADAGQSSLLVEMGWAEVVKEKKPETKPATKKTKATKKK